MLSLGNAFADEEVRGIRRAHPPLPAMARPRRRSPSRPSRRSTACRSACATRTDSLVSAATRGDGAVGEDVTAMPARSSDIPQRLKGADVPDICRGARRDLSLARGFCRHQRAAGGGRQAALRQSAQCRGRQPAPARSVDHRIAAVALLRLCLGRDERDAGDDAIRHDRMLQALRPQDQSADTPLHERRRAARALPRHRDRPRQSRLRHRRRRLQGRRS